MGLDTMMTRIAKLLLLAGIAFSCPLDVFNRTALSKKEANSQSD